jgi:glycosyltransferase involved in cell wall biosynthesis
MTRMKIYHCITQLNENGGMQTYIRSLLKYQNRSDEHVINLHTSNSQNNFQMLHLHDPNQVSVLNNHCPAIFTLHNHSTYCPSGRKYFKTQEHCCDRPASYLGCTWGHLAQGCGSLRPQRMMKTISRTYKEIENLKKKEVITVAVSNYARHCLIQQGLPTDQVFTVHHGVDYPSIAHESLTESIHKNQRLLFVGRIVPEKGLGWLFRALAKTSSSIQLDIAGEGWEETGLKHLAKELNIENRIKWHGWCNSSELDSLYKNCFAVVFPSLWPEPAGLISLEAYARYRPVITSQVGGIPEYVINKKTGILVEPNKDTSLAQAIESIASSFDKARFLGDMGHDYFQTNFTLEHHLQKLDIIYEKAQLKFAQFFC